MYLLVEKTARYIYIYIYSLFLFQKGRPTEAMKEVIVHEYGESNALDYIPGAEVLKTSDQVEDQEQSAGKAKTKAGKEQFILHLLLVVSGLQCRKVQ